MHHNFIHLSQWLFLSVLLFSLQVSATPCKNCGKESEPGEDGQMFCQNCDSGKSASAPSGPSSSADEDLKSSAAGKNATGATNDEIPDSPDLNTSRYSVLLLKEGNVLMSQVKISEAAVAAAEGEGGNAFAREFAKTIAENLLTIARSTNTDHMIVDTVEMRDQMQERMVLRDQQKNKMTIFPRLHQAQLCAGAEETKRIPIHERAEALTHQRAGKIALSQWPIPSDTGMIHLLSAGFQNSRLMMDLTSVFKAIQEGDMVQLIITRTVTDESNQAAAGTARPTMLGSIIPAPTMNDHTESSDMHLLMGPRPVRVSQHNLMNVLIAIMKVLDENEHNAHLSLHFFLIPQTYIQDNEDPLTSISDIESSINPNLPVAGFANDKPL
ncbi:hypothetical protein [Endozoicomonas sp. ALD040]|uniref:hypothetical protein n=3 Tax=unclassified Endozoicomonas TaxID=2644528 RepID=UPI003BAFAE7E